jgi:hypothetical protein
MGGLTKAQYGLIGPEEEQKPGVARVMGADEEGTPVLRPTTGYHLPEVEISAKAPDTYNNYIRNKYKDAGLGAVMFGMPLDYAFGFPQAAMTKAFTGKYQLPSEAMGIENPVGALLTDAALDPVNITGAGLLTKEKALAALAELKPYQNLNFRGITPVGYGARDKILNYIPNVLRYTPEKKLEDIMVAFEQGASTSRKHIKKIRNDVRRHMSLTDEQYRALPVDETKDMMSRTNFKNLEEQARKRVDSFRKGLGLEQQYGTFEPVGDNVFRIIDSDIEKGRFSTLWNDIRANDLKNKVYVGDNDPLVSLTEQHNKITDNKLYTPDSFYSINDLRNYLNKTGDVKFKPWKQTRIVENARNPEFKWSIYDADPKGIQGAFRWDVKKTNDGLLHFQANDTWDLHPWQTRGRINLEEDALDIANRNLNSKDLLKNIEALRLLGGKPFDIRNNYLVDPETMNIVKQWRKGGSLPKHQNGKLKVRLHKRQ